MEICGHPKEVWNRFETVWNCRKAAKSAHPTFICIEICGHPKEVWNRSETVWNCRKAAISADPTCVWKFVDIPKRIWKLMAGPKRSETGLEPSETVGKQLNPLILHLYGKLWTSQRGLKQVWNRLKLQESNCIWWSYISMEINGHPKEVWNRSETVWNCRKAAISADPTFVWKFVDVPKRSETGLKPSETVGKQLYFLIPHLYKN